MGDDVIKWLHLSDLHLGPSRKWIWSWLKSHLLPDLEDLHRHSGPWDLVLVTGDLVNRGSEAEFRALDEVLADLWKHLEKLQPHHRVHLLAVPGNHDLNRPAALQALGPAYLADHDLQALEDRESRAAQPLVQQIVAAFDNYDRWWRRCPHKPDASSLSVGLYPGDFAASLQIRSVKLGVVGLNSALLHLTGGDYRERLWIHPRQFYAACPGENGPEWADAHHVCLLLTHHPSTWLSQEARNLLHGCIADRGRFLLHLLGHQHETALHVEGEAGLALNYCWQSSALMGSEEIEVGGKKLTRPSYGYAVGELDCSNKDQCRVRFWPRAATKLGTGASRLGLGEWHFATETTRIATRNGVSPWYPPGRFDNTDTDPPPPATDPPPPAAWFEVVIGAEGEAGLLAESERLNLIASERNPYEPGTSLNANSPVFVGRQRQLTEVRESLVHSHKPLCVSLLGERRIGKSSFLNQLVASLATERDLVVVRTSVQEWCKPTPERFFQELHRSLSGKLPLSELKGAADYGACKQALTVQSRRFRFVIVVDEFDLLLNYPAFDREFYWNLRALADSGRIRLGYLLCSRQSLSAMCQESHDIKASAFWNIFLTTHTLGLLDSEAVARLRETVWCRSTLKPPPDGREIHRLTGAHPAHVQMALQRAWSGAYVGQRDLAAHFVTLWDHRSETERALLRAIAQGERPKGDEPELEELVVRGVLDAEGSPFAHAFGEWIRTRGAGSQ